MRYPTLAETLALAEIAIGLPASMARNDEMCRHLCLNHPFPDGNKRMAWMVTLLFLELNDHEMYQDDLRAICVTVEIASSNTNNEEVADAFSRWIRRKEPVAVG